MIQQKYSRWLRSNLGIATGVVAVTAFTAFSYVNHARDQQDTDWLNHSYEVLGGLKSVRLLIDEMQSGQRGFAISSQENFLDLYSHAKERLSPQILALSKLVADNPKQTDRISKVETEANYVRELMEKNVALVSSGQADSARAAISSGVLNAKIQNLREDLDEMEADESALLNQRLTRMQISSRNTDYSMLFGAGLTLATLMLAGYALNRRLREQLRAEQELSRFFDNSLDIFCITDPESRFVRFNHQAPLLLGYAASELASMSLVDLVHPSDASIVRTARTRRQEGQPISGLEFRLRKKDGTYTWFAWHSAFDPSVGLIYSVGRDVTERRRLEEENARTRTLAQEANQAKSEFLASMSHEIRTPMNAIIGMAEVLSETPLTEEQAQYVRVFRNAGNALLNLINDILDLSRIEAGKIEIHHVPFNVHNLVMGIVDLLSLKASQKGLVLEGVIDPKVPALVKGDPDRIRQVVSNLVGNAVKFTPEGNVRVLLSPQTREGKNGVLITVEDTGLGIPENAKSHIFAKYERSSATVQLEGTGLGLHISRQLVEKMGGSLWFESEMGKGSRFFCWLPLLHEEAATATSAPVAAADGQNPLEILLTDDNEDNRLIVISYLKKTPHKVTQAENGQKALDLFRVKKFDLVLMDIHMPVMDGLTAVRAMRDFERQKARPRIPILALTAYSLKDEEEKSLQAGCDAHLSKPIKKQTLLKALADFSPENA